MHFSFEAIFQRPEVRTCAECLQYPVVMKTVQLGITYYKFLYKKLIIIYVNGKICNKRFHLMYQHGFLVFRFKINLSMGCRNISEVSSAFAMLKLMDKLTAIIKYNHRVSPSRVLLTRLLFSSLVFIRFSILLLMFLCLGHYPLLHKL